MTPLNRILLLFVCVSPYFSKAQPLAVNNTNPSQSNRRPSAVPEANPWQKAEDQLTGSFNRNVLAKLKATNVTLVSYLKDSCLADPTLRPVWHGEYTTGKAAVNSDIRFGVRCTFNTAVLSVMANDLSPVLGQVAIYGQDYTTLAVMPSTRNQCTYFDVPVSKGASRNHVWLITQQPGDLPYTVITRKDYLGKMLTSLAKVKEHITADIKQKAPVRSTEEQEAAKNKDLESYRSIYTGSELEMRKRNYLEHYKSDEDYQKEKVDAATADVDSTISFIDGMLHRLSPGTLASPAIVSTTVTDFEGFADGEPGAVMLVEPKPFIADATNAPEKPRYFILSWNYSPSDETAAAIERSIGLKLDTRLLRDLLK
jgi:hypothetical protein